MRTKLMIATVTAAALMFVGWTTVAVAQGCPASNSTVEYIDIDGISCTFSGVTVTNGNVQAKGTDTEFFQMFDTVVENGDVQIEGFGFARVGERIRGRCDFRGRTLGIDIVNGNLQMKENADARASCNQLDNGNVQIEKNTRATVIFNNADNGNIQCVDNGSLFAGGNTTADENSCP